MRRLPEASKSIHCSDEQVFDRFAVNWGVMSTQAAKKLWSVGESGPKSSHNVALIYSKLSWYYQTTLDEGKSRQCESRVPQEFKSVPQVYSVLTATKALRLFADSKTAEALEVLGEIPVEDVPVHYKGRLLSFKGNMLRQIGALKEAESVLEDAQYLLRNSTDRSLLGVVSLHQGNLFKAQSDFLLAARYCKKAIDAFGVQENVLMESRARFGRMILLRKVGKLQSAKSDAAELIVSDLPTRFRVRYHNEYCRLYIALEEKQTADHLLRLIEDYTDENTPIRSRVITNEAEADFHALSRDWPRALNALDSGIEKALTISESNDLLGELYRRKARVLYELGMDDEAFEMAKHSLEICHEVSEIYEIGANFRTLGLLAEHRGELDEAESLLLQAVNFYQSRDEKFERSHSHKDVAQFYHRRGDDKSMREAFKHAASALSLFEEMGVEPRVMEMRELLETLSSSIPRRPFIAPDSHQLVQIGEEHGIITGDVKMKQVLETMVRVAPSNASVLITGDTGTGKELVAKAVHAMSDRADKAMVIVNCAAIPAELMESEIFGHLKGSFTGAFRDRIGKFALADGGTLFLDEIGDLDKQLQAKLLRVLEDGSYTPVGAEEERHVDVRVIAATNRDLDELLQKQLFREDLLYRLNDVMLELPSLRSRGADVELLTLYFLHHEGESFGQSIHIDPHALDLIIGHDWPGNVRELLSFIRQMVLHASETGLLTVDLFPESFFSKAGREPRNLSGIVRLAETTAIVNALTRAKGNKAKAARDLDVSRSTLGDKITRLNLTSELERIIERAEKRDWA
jgi:transcriptional regulator with PAS, ATPase and Fis domain